MTTPTKPSDPNQGQPLTPAQLAEQLFDAAAAQALAQKVTDPREVARRVVGFLTDALFYAVTSTKNDLVVFLTESIIYVASSSVAGDEAARKELLRHIGDTIANAPPFPANATAASKP